MDVPEKRPRRGGARNRSDRESAELTIHQCEGLLRASERAVARGMSFNMHVTLNWFSMAIPARSSTPATVKFVELARGFLRTHGYSLLWVYVQEVGLQHGSHTHLLLHIPPELRDAFQRKWPAWKKILIQKFAGHVVCAGRAKHSRSIGRSYLAFKTAPDLYARQLRAIVEYLMKGAPPEVLDRLLCSQTHRPCGLVFGKRAGWWQERRC
jgi:hypothetical protein